MNMAHAGCCFSTNCSHVHVISNWAKIYSVCVTCDYHLYTPGHTIKTTIPTQGYLPFTFGMESAETKTIVLVSGNG